MCYHKNMMASKAQSEVYSPFVTFAFVLIFVGMAWGKNVSTLSDKMVFTVEKREVEMRAINRLRVSSDGRYFLDGEKPVALFGSGLWTIIPDTTIDIEDHNRWYARYGSNANRATLFAFCTRVGEGRGVCPWERTGPGTANDGKPKFDLTKPNEAFWKRAHEYFESTRRHGIYVLLQIFDEPFIERSKDRWWLNPFNPENNVNDLPRLPGGIGSGEEAFYDPDNAPLMAIQDALVKRLLDETALRYGHIIYEIGNEINMDSLTSKAERWQQHWIDFFRAYEKEHNVNLLLSNDTRRSLLQAAGEGFQVINHHGALGVRIPLKQIGDMPIRLYDAITRDFARWRRPILNSRPCSDPDRTDYPDIVTEEVGRAIYWSYFCSGGHIIGFRTTEESWKGGLAAERILQHLHNFIRRTRFWEMAPRQDLVDGDNLCLAHPGNEYIVYLPHGGAVNVRLEQGDYSAVWYNPRTGEWSEPFHVEGGGRQALASRFIWEFTAPDERDWTLLIRAGRELDD